MLKDSDESSSSKVVSDVERLQQSIAKLEEENARLGTELQRKSQDYNNVKNEVQKGKLAIKRLEQTMIDFAAENQKMADEKKAAQVIFETSMAKFY